MIRPHLKFAQTGSIKQPAVHREVVYRFPATYHQEQATARVTAMPSSCWACSENSPKRQGCQDFLPPISLPFRSAWRIRARPFVFLSFTRPSLRASPTLAHPQLSLMWSPLPGQAGLEPQSAALLNQLWGQSQEGAWPGNSAAGGLMTPQPLPVTPQTADASSPAWGPAPEPFGQTSQGASHAAASKLYVQASRGCGRVRCDAKP